jgi:hypothetical protein
MLSFPIPDPDSAQARRYDDLTPRGVGLGRMLRDLMGPRFDSLGPAHLDPDIDASAVPRRLGWRPIFGQSYAAEAHLRARGVCPGDLFLFFGWFKQVACVNGKYGYVRGSPHVHCLFGWLQIGERLATPHADDVPEWARDHPHVSATPARYLDSLYVSADRLTLPGYGELAAGGGVFPTYSPGLTLTAPGRSRSWWDLPPWFAPAGRTPLSYHAAPARWTTNDGRVTLRSVPRGQEFVLDAEEYPEAVGWAAELLMDAGVAVINGDRPRRANGIAHSRQAQALDHKPALGKAGRGRGSHR